jgi:hypothetical protein
MEADAVAVLDRLNRSLAPAPAERDEDRVARADRRHLRQEGAGGDADQAEGADRPQAQEGDPALRLGRQAGLRARSAKRRRKGLGRAFLRSPDEADPSRDEPPATQDRQREERRLFPVSQEHRDGAERGRHSREEENGQAK